MLVNVSTLSTYESPFANFFIVLAKVSKQLHYLSICISSELDDVNKATNLVKISMIFSS